MRGFLQPPAHARDNARALRRTQTPAEATLWRALRSNGLGHKARRQVPVGPYILDFAFIPQRLAIEVDGETHALQDAQQSDAQRTAWLETAGWRVLRFTNRDVLSNLDGVLQTITPSLHLPPTPPPQPGQRP